MKNIRSTNNSSLIYMCEEMQTILQTVDNIRPNNH